jgi:hypothetical protein
VTTPGDGTFLWRGEELAYETGAYNRAAENERAVEVPVALRWLSGRDPSAGLEVGNVTGHYAPGLGHPVVDRYESAPGVDNLDVFDVGGSYGWILAVSTLEHVRWDPPEEQEPDGAERAAGHLRSLLRPGGAMLATVPFGQNPHLDTAILGGGLSASREATLVKGPDGWTAHEGERIWRPAGNLRWAGAVWVGEWLA